MNIDVSRPELTAGTTRTVEGAPPLLAKEHDDAPTEVGSRILRGFDSDQLRESFRPGILEHRLLAPGDFDAHLIRVSTAKLALQIVRYSLPVALNGTWPETRVALLFAFDVPEGALVHGQPFQSGALLVLDGSTGIEARLSTHSTCAILVVERELLDGALLDAGVSLELGRAMPGRLFRAREREARRLTGLLRAIVDDVDLARQLLNAPPFSVAFERDVLRAFARALANAEEFEKKGLNVLDRRNRMVRKTEAFVVAHLDESIRMERLCKEIGASPRALEYAFRAVYGTGAMRYLRMVRLNEARKALLRPSAERAITVTSTAMDWGFWHLGEFAAAYRRLFGETPSATLRLAAAKDVVPAVLPLSPTRAADTVSRSSVRRARVDWSGVARVAPTRPNSMRLFEDARRDEGRQGAYHCLSRRASRSQSGPNLESVAVDRERR